MFEKNSACLQVLSGAQGEVQLPRFESGAVCASVDNLHRKERVEIVHSRKSTSGTHEEECNWTHALWHVRAVGGVLARSMCQPLSAAVST